jgi:type III secretory pathway component EscS
MKKIFYIVIGVILGTVIGFFAASWISNIYDYYWATTGILTLPEALALFAIWACFMVFGGIVGNVLFHYNLSRNLKLPYFNDSNKSNA